MSEKKTPEQLFFERLSDWGYEIIAAKVTNDMTKEEGEGTGEALTGK